MTEEQLVTKRQYPAMIIVEVPIEVFEELEEDGWVKVALCKQRVGKGVRYFTKKITNGGK